MRLYLPTRRHHQTSFSFPEDSRAAAALPAHRKLRAAVSGRAIATALLATQLTGCTIALGRAFSTSADQTQDRLDLANLSCTHDAEMGWQSFGHQTAQFFLWPFSIPWERHYKQSTWQQCMVNKGYRVVTPSGEPVNPSATPVETAAIPPPTPTTPILSPRLITPSDPPPAPRDAAWLECFQTASDRPGAEFRPALERCMKERGYPVEASAQETKSPAADSTSPGAPPGPEALRAIGVGQGPGPK